MNPEHILLYQRILNSFENDSGSPETDYRTIYIYSDGNNGRRQVTLARGFTSDGGNLQKVMERYVSNGGADSSYMKSMLKASTPAMVADREFHRRLHDAGDEQAMKDAQDKVFQDVYLAPALKWAERYGFTLPLSVGVIVDSYLHSGGMLGWLMNKFPEKKPSSGGDEKKWIKSYLLARLAWLSSANKLLRNTVYRPKFFLGEIKKDNWNLNPPLVANGNKIS